MNALSQVFLFKIFATLFVWCGPLLLLSQQDLIELGLPVVQSAFFVRMLAWAYLALCLGYVFGLRASLKGKRSLGPIWVGVVSNGGACLILSWHLPQWFNWGTWMAVIGITSMLATAAITLGLVLFGLRGEGDAI